MREKSKVRSQTSEVGPVGNIDRASPAEFGELAKLGQEFFAEGKLPGRLVPGVFCETWERLYAADMGVIFALWRDGGIIGAIGGAVYPDPNDGELVAMEFFWFVTAEARGRGLALLSRFEAWAKERGAVRIAMIHLNNLQPARLCELYHRRGYREIETHYIKEI